IRARASTSGLKAGWAVTSVIRSPFIQTSRPSWIDARYSSPLRIIRPSSVARVSMRNRGAFGKKILTLYCRDFDYTAGGERGIAVSPRRGRAIDVFAPTTKTGPALEPDRSLAARNSRSLRLMKRHARTLPLFITMVAMLVFAAPAYGALAKPTVTAPTNGASYNTLPHFSWNPVTGADHYEFQIAADAAFTSSVLGFGQDDFITKN